MKFKIASALLLSTALLVTGCGKKQQAADQQQPQQQAQQQPPPQPEPQPPQQTPPPETVQHTPPAPEPVPERKAAPAVTKKPAEAPKPLVIPAGTPLAVRTTTEINSSKVQPGQAFDASLAQPIMVHGTAVAPRGAPVSGKIVESASAGRVKGEGTLSLELVSISVKGHSYAVATSPHTETAKSRGKRSATMIGGGTGVGALIGGIAGGGKGAAIGALAGAGAGTAGATMTGKRDVVIPSESVLNFTLSQPLKLRPGTASTDAVPDYSDQTPPSSDQPR